MLKNIDKSNQKIHCFYVKGFQELLRILDKYEELGVPANRRIQKISKTNLFGSSKFPCLLHIKGRKIRTFADVAVSG